MRAKDRKTFTEAWNRHITALAYLPGELGAADQRRWAEIEKDLREWVTVVADMAFPEPDAAGELPNGSEP